MVKTFNTCADYHVKYQSTELGCKNKFTASVNVGTGQQLIFANVGRTPNFVLPATPVSNDEWAIILKRNNTVIETLKLKGLVNHKTIGAQSAVASTEDAYTAHLAMVNAAGAEQPVTEAQLETAFGALNPIVIGFLIG